MARRAAIRIDLAEMRRILMRFQKAETQMNSLSRLSTGFHMMEVVWARSFSFMCRILQVGVNSSKICGSDSMWCPAVNEYNVLRSSNVQIVNLHKTDWQDNLEYLESVSNVSARCIFFMFYSLHDNEASPFQCYMISFHCKRLFEKWLQGSFPWLCSVVKFILEERAPITCRNAEFLSRCQIIHSDNFSIRIATTHKGSG